MTILNPLIPSASVDVVNIYLTAPAGLVPNIPGLPPVASDFLPSVFIPIPLLINARPTLAEVRPTSLYMDHPVERGAVVTDHKIDNPLELALTVVIRSEQYRLTYLFLEASRREAVNFTVQTKASTYSNLFISEIPHEESPDRFDVLTMVIQFREVDFVTARVQDLPNDAISDPLDTSTLPRGEQEFSVLEPFTPAF